MQKVYYIHVKVENLIRVEPSTIQLSSFHLFNYSTIHFAAVHQSEGEEQSEGKGVDQSRIVE